MKFNKFLFLHFLFLILVGCNFMSTPYDIEDLKALGEKPFTEEAWSSASRLERGAMLYDLVKTHNFIGQPVDNVYDTLGQSSSYFYQEYNAGYAVSSRANSQDTEKKFTFAFLVDPKTRLVKDYALEAFPTP